MATQQIITKIIKLIKESEEEGSVTNDMVGTVLEFLNSMSMSAHGLVDDSGIILQSKLPQSVTDNATPEIQYTDVHDLTKLQIGNSKHNRFRVMKGRLCIGILDVIYNGTMDMITQIYRGSYLLDQYPAFEQGSKLEVGEYFRMRPLSGSYPGSDAVQSGPAAGWSKWQRMSLTREQLKQSLKSMLGESDTITNLFIPFIMQAFSPCDGILWPEAKYERRLEPIRECGYYSEVNAQSPFYFCGIWLRFLDAMRVIADRYTPYMGGVLPSAPVNLPVNVKTSDSNLRLDYAAVNSDKIEVLVLSSKGWNASITPASAVRAFHWANALKAVVGEIDLRNVKSQNDIRSMFAHCPELWQFHLANIPDSIEFLDLSEVSDRWVENFEYEDGYECSSLRWLLENLERDITRTKPLTVKVSGQVWNDYIDGNAYYLDYNITWVTE